ncbi:MAG: type IV toxin-antitoxin system AbiEi family antitoxin domain-containing protein [Anaerolineae bacterium]
MIKNIVPQQDDRLGPRERRFLAGLAGEGKRVFRLDDALPYWPSRHAARRALSRLEAKGWLQRLERGLYLIVPLEAGPAGRWSEDPLVIAAQLDPKGAVGYWSALHYWGMTEQFPRTTFVQTTRRRHTPRIEILGVRYRFVVVVRRKAFGIVTRASEGLEFRVTDKEKTLIDACDRPELAGGIPQIVEALRSGVPLEWETVDDYLARFGSGAVYKRLGFLIERLDVQVPDSPTRLERWRGARSQGVAKLDPGGSDEGRIDTSWSVKVNVRGLEDLA